MLSRAAALLSFLPLLHAALPKPPDWVPARWPFADTRSLELLDRSPVNCLLVSSPTPEFTAAANARGIVVVTVSGPPDDLALAAPDQPTIRRTSRVRLNLASASPIIDTTQGVWPGVAAEENAHNAGP